MSRRAAILVAVPGGLPAAAEARRAQCPGGRFVAYLMVDAYPAARATVAIPAP